MEKNKNKYEIILGFVTLVISLSAFKDELSKVSLELGYLTISLADYFLWVVYGLSISLYFYVTEMIAKDTKVGKWRLFNYTIKFAYVLFVFILITPIILITNIVFYKSFNAITENYEEASSVYAIVLNIISGVVGAVVSWVATTKLLKDKKQKSKEEIEEQEIKDLDNATRLFNDRYYSHSVLESFKVLESHLYKKLIEKDFRVPRFKLNEIIQIAIKEKIINQSDLSAINDIRGMRNAAAHSDTEYTKNHAEFALNFVRELIKRNDNNQNKASSQQGV